MPQQISANDKNTATSFHSVANVNRGVNSRYLSRMLSVSSHRFMNGPCDDAYDNVIHYLRQGALPEKSLITSVFKNKNDHLITLFRSEGFFIENFDHVYEALTTEVAPEKYYTYLSEWESIQRKVNESYMMPYNIGDNGCITCVDDITNPPNYSNQDDKPNTYFNSSDSVFMQAARAGDFSKILDLYIAEKKPFPYKVLSERNGEHSVADILKFKKEPEIWQKLMHPNIWVGQKKQMKDVFYQILPHRARGQMDFTNILNRLDRTTLRTGDQAKPNIKRRRPTNS